LIRLQKGNNLKISKYSFCQNSIKYLRYVVSGTGISLDSTKVEHVTNTIPSKILKKL
jgi:hypothetical protein